MRPAAPPSDAAHPRDGPRTRDPRMRMRPHLREGGGSGRRTADGGGLRVGGDVERRSSHNLPLSQRGQRAESTLSSQRLHLCRAQGRPNGGSASNEAAAAAGAAGQGPGADGGRAPAMPGLPVGRTRGANGRCGRLQGRCGRLQGQTVSHSPHPRLSSERPPAALRVGGHRDPLPGPG